MLMIAQELAISYSCVLQVHRPCRLYLLAFLRHRHAWRHRKVCGLRSWSLSAAQGRTSLRMSSIQWVRKASAHGGWQSFGNDWRQGVPPTRRQSWLNAACRRGLRVRSMLATSGDGLRSARSGTKLTSSDWACPEDQVQPLQAGSTSVVQEIDSAHRLSKGWGKG